MREVVSGRGGALRPSASEDSGGNGHAAGHVRPLGLAREGGDSRSRKRKAACCETSGVDPLLHHPRSGRAHAGRYTDRCGIYEEKAFDRSPSG